jgi:ribosomal protein L31
LTLQQIDHYLWNTMKESETDRPTNDGEVIPKCHPAYQATQKQQLE